MWRWEAAPWNSQSGLASSISSTSASCLYESLPRTWSKIVYRIRCIIACVHRTDLLSEAINDWWIGSVLLNASAVVYPDVLRVCNVISWAFGEMNLPLGQLSKQSFDTPLNNILVVERFQISRWLNLHKMKYPMEFLLAAIQMFVSRVVFRSRIRYSSSRDAFDMKGISFYHSSEMALASSIMPRDNFSSHDSAGNNFSLVISTRRRRQNHDRKLVSRFCDARVLLCLLAKGKKEDWRYPAESIAVSRRERKLRADKSIRFTSPFYRRTILLAYFRVAHFHAHVHNPFMRFTSGWTGLYVASACNRSRHTKKHFAIQRQIPRRKWR